ncbi:hypothetical protein EUGRSUZ_I02317 [Eucalyptus grandis]|uniref:Uncharacterized protein n=2 Tax=Eucalyptus grandis TaxID=71139 RepID=A0A059ARK1_EUCGR|nr:hypothetical protein EUGRSUZ_I02317 [Eucalyptus grandis]
MQNANEVTSHSSVNASKQPKQCLKCEKAMRTSLQRKISKMTRFITQHVMAHTNWTRMQYSSSQLSGL